MATCIFGFANQIFGQPIQRVCKYPLLFADLYKYTPASDDAESRREIEKVLARLRETAQEINKATNDQEARDRIQRSWHLQDLLTIPDVVRTSQYIVIIA